MYNRLFTILTLYFATLCAICARGSVMRVLGVIPARYSSTRFPGKPLADICGKPMIWWVYQEAIKVKTLSELLVAIDDERIAHICEALRIPYIMTASNHKTHIHRIFEVSQAKQADLYVVVCGDEPLIDSLTIAKVIPQNVKSNQSAMWALMRRFTDPVEVIDPNNIKISTTQSGECLYLSRSPIPFPFKSIMFAYHKIIGVECYTKSALESFVTKSQGKLEAIEDIALLRFLENGIPMYFTEVQTNALAVDTQSDLQKVRHIIEQRLQRNG